MAALKLLATSVDECLKMWPVAVVLTDNCDLLILLAMVVSLLLYTDHNSKKKF